VPRSGVLNGSARSIISWNYTLSDFRLVGPTSISPGQQLDEIRHRLDLLCGGLQLYYLHFSFLLFGGYVFGGYARPAITA
jgi:hypothetical protein